MVLYLSYLLLLSGWSDFKVTPTELTFTFKSGTSGPDWPEDSDGSYKVTDYFKIVKS